MFTVNLEKELIKQNRRLATPKELLLVREYESLGDDANDALQRVGMAETYNKGKEVKQRLDSANNVTARFNQERVFHITQIKALCNKYYLRFLPSNMFKGNIDPALPLKITTFETAYGVKCGSTYREFDRRYRQQKSDTYIMAPATEFELQEKPKDPLFFYQINDEYYYLIHKWGNDLSWSRRLLPFLSKPISVVTANFAVGIILAYIWSILYNKSGQHPLLFIPAVLLFIVFIAASMASLIERFGLIKKNKWNSPLK